MKKTLIVLFALSGSLLADTVTGSFVYSATATENKYTVTFDKPLLTMSDIKSDKVQKDISSITLGTDPDTFTVDEETAYTPDVNIGTQAGTWTLSFTLTNQTQEEMVLDSMIFDIFLFNSGGSKQQPDDVERPVTFTLAQVVDTVSTMIGSVTTPKYVASQNYGVILDITNNLTLAGGQTVKFALTAADGDTNTGNGTFVGLSSVGFKTIPEPTTATLSLLALAGLAARRRRK